MTKRVGKVPLDISVMDAIKKMFVMNVGALVIVDENESIAGIFTERDVIRRVIPKKFKLEKTDVSKVMTSNPLTVTVDTPITEIYKTMNRMNFRHVPVMDGAKIVGIISLKDIAKACME